MNRKPAVAVSKCLLGVNCKYSGGNNHNQLVIDHLSDKVIIPICPEEMGGLSTPRKTSEIIHSGNELIVITSDGEDVTASFKAGAKMALDEAIKNQVDYAILKARSPSCGCGEIYDGTFSHKVIRGNGITAQMFLDHGITVKTEEDI